MLLPKDINIEILENSWPASNDIPATLRRFASQPEYRIDTAMALLFAAIWMRPPTQYGFSLSDCWAWLRYFPAICSHSSLRLREEWTTLDPHHKTILSSDFGVGFTTLFLHQELGFIHYADTLWVVNAITQNPHFHLGASSTKRGRDKSPDYVAIDNTNHFSVLECKGTQSSRQGLYKALERGRPQKRNLQAVAPQELHHSLVAGFLIPQWESDEFALLAICDPEPEDVEDQLSRFNLQEIGRGAMQVSLAKELALFELSHSANTMVRAKGSRDRPCDAIEDDLRSARVVGRSLDHNELRMQRDFFWAEPAKLVDGISISGVSLEQEVSREDLRRLTHWNNPQDLGEEQWAKHEQHKWEVKTSDLSLTLISPFEIRYRLSLLEA